MRVIAGTARRLKLETPAGRHTRPTSDKIKETLFNIIQQDLYEARFLDLFSGSGGIAIEALSRCAGRQRPGSTAVHPHEPSPYAF